MSVPGTNALYQPTLFPRTGQVPLDVDQTNGVPTDFGGSDPFSTGGDVTRLYDNATDYNTGFNAVNRPITQTYAVDNTQAAPLLPKDMRAWHHESLVVASQPRRLNQAIISSNEQPITSLISFSAWNAMMRMPGMRKQFGRDTHVANIKIKYRFIGSVKKPGGPSAPEEAVAVIVAGRARIMDISRAYVPSGSEERYHPLRGIIGQMDHLWVIYRRYRYDAWLSAQLNNKNITDERKLELHMLQEQDASINAAESDAYSHFWNMEVFVNRSGEPPHPALYTQEYAPNKADNYIGEYEHIGFVGFVYGNREPNADSVERARKIIRGQDDFLKETPFLEAIELFIGVH